VTICCLRTGTASTRAGNRWPGGYPWRSPLPDHRGVRLALRRRGLHQALGGLLAERRHLTRLHRTPGWQLQRDRKRRAGEGWRRHSRFPQRRQQITPVLEGHLADHLPDRGQREDHLRDLGGGADHISGMLDAADEALDEAYSEIPCCNCAEIWNEAIYPEIRLGGQSCRRGEPARRVLQRSCEGLAFRCLANGNTGPARMRNALTRPRGPNMLIVGPQKAGTTWLYSAFRQQPDVFLRESTELHYFNQRAKCNDKQFATYLENFRDAGERILDENGIDRMITR
jgi:hypothetical protein